jgi:transposase
MTGRRVGVDRLRELVRLHRMGTSSVETARLLRMSVNTERPYRLALEKAGLLKGPVDDLPELEVLKAAVVQFLPPKVRPQQVSSVEKWKDEIAGLVEKDLTAQAIFDRLRVDPQKEFTGSLSAVKRLYSRLRTERGVRPEDVAIRVETEPGEIAQVDFGYVGELYDPDEGVLRRAWCFVMVLGYSRHMFARIVFDQKVGTWLRLHAEALGELGGVVETVVPDNLKSAVIRAAFAFDVPTALNRSYREFAQYYNFKIDPAPPKAPKKKGKVEAGVKYVKRNFFKGRHGQDVTVVAVELERWVREIAGRRDHGRTHRQPLEVFELEERPALKALPLVPWEPIEWKEALVHPDTHVVFDRKPYSVPWQLVGKKTWIRATRSSVVIYHDDARVATHVRCGPHDRGRTLDEHLPQGRADLRHRSRGYWEERARRIGPDVLEYVRAVFDSDEVLSMLRQVQAIVTHVEKFPRDRAQAACRRAHHYANFTYKGLKNILRQALDLEPLPGAVPITTPPIVNPRFARSTGDLFHNVSNEEIHDSNGRPDPASQEAPTLGCAPDA